MTFDEWWARQLFKDDYKELARRVWIAAREPERNTTAMVNREEQSSPPLRRICSCPGACQGAEALSKGLVCALLVPQSLTRTPQQGEIK